MSQENVEIVRRTYDDWSRGDFTTGYDQLERNVTLVIDSALPDSGVFAGPEGVRRYMENFLAAWASLTISADSVQAIGDSVLAAVRQVAVGRESGVQLEMGYFQLWTFRGGRVIRLVTIVNRDEAFEAAGKLSE